MRREALRPGDRVSGPAVLVEPHTSILVEPGWRARVTAHDHVRAGAGGGAGGGGGGRDQGRSGDARGLQQPLHVDRRADGGGAGEHRRQRDDQGAAGFLLRGLRRARATSSPMRRTCRCISASMGASVKAIIAQNPEMAPGDVFVLNAPYNGGTHLPDITVVRPVWDEARRAGAVLHRGAGAPYRRRRADAGVDAAGQPDHPRRGRLYRQLEAGRGRAVPRGGDAGAARSG